MVGVGHRRARPWEPLRRISDRTPLRTKLITAVLALVIMALLAISIASVAIGHLTPCPAAYTTAYFVDIKNFAQA